MSEQLFIKYLSGKNLKLTSQRRLILDAFMDHGGHVSSEELYDAVKAKEPGIGQATVYRTLKLLYDAGIANEVFFGDGVSRYEPNREDEHHDHIVCTECLKQVEFHDPAIEDLQIRQAENHGFTLQSHRMVLYGTCRDCT